MNCSHKNTHKIGGREFCASCLSAISHRAIDAASDFEVAQARTKQAYRLRSTEVPNRFLSASFDNFAPPNDAAATILAGLKTYADRFIEEPEIRRSVVFCGPPGVGKTHLASALLLDLAGQGVDARYASLPAVMIQAKRATGSAIFDLITDLAAPDILVIDEIDLHGGTDAAYQLLHEIIDSRYRRNSPVVCISNKTPKDLEQDIGDRMMRRMTSGLAPIEFFWKPYRANHQNAHRP